MSALEACRVYVGTTFFLRWDPHNKTAPLIQVYINRVDICADRNPRRLLVFVTRKHPVIDDENVMRLTIHQADDHSIPSISYTGTDEVAKWSLPPDRFIKSKNKAPTSLSHLKGPTEIRENIPFVNRALRALSHKIQNGLDGFPSLPNRNLNVYG